MRTDYSYKVGQRIYLRPGMPKAADKLISSIADGVTTHYATSKGERRWWRIVFKERMSSIGLAFSPRWVPCPQPAWAKAERPAP